MCLGCKEYSKHSKGHRCDDLNHTIDIVNAIISKSDDIREMEIQTDAVSVGTGSEEVVKLQKELAKEKKRREAAEEVMEEATETEDALQTVMEALMDSNDDTILKLLQNRHPEVYHKMRGRLGYKD